MHLQQNEIQYILDNYEKFGPTAVAKALGRNPSTITRYAMKVGLSYKKRISDTIPEFVKKSTLDDIIEKGMTKEIAYFLGYFWADGTISGNSLRIELEEEDCNELEQICNTFYSFNTSKRTRTNRKPQKSLYCIAPKLAQLLISFGKYPNSSENHSKILEYVDPYQIYFIAGLIDGDGCWYINDKCAQFSISSNYNQDWSTLQDFFKNFSCNIHTEIHNTDKSSLLRITNILELRKLVTDLNDKVSFGLSRKINKRNKVFEFKYKMYDFPIKVNGIKYDSVKEFCNTNNYSSVEVFKRLNNSNDKNFEYGE